MRIKKGDTYPLRLQLVWEDNTPIDLSDASHVTIKIKKDGSTTPEISGTCTIEDTTNGIVSYDWADGNLNTVGMYFIEFEIIYNTGEKLTVPTGEMILWVVGDVG